MVFLSFNKALAQTDLAGGAGENLVQGVLIAFIFCPGISTIILKLMANFEIPSFIF